MLFNSLTFFALLLPTLAAYWLAPWQRARLALLLAASLVFYSYFHWPSVFLLLFTISFNYGMGRRQARIRSRVANNSGEEDLHRSSLRSRLCLSDRRSKTAG